jgi:hypothetical protein
MSLFESLIVSKEAEKLELMAYPSDIQMFKQIVKRLNENLNEGEIREEEVFSKLVHFANEQVGTKLRNGEEKRGRKSLVKNISKKLAEQDISLN